MISGSLDYLRYADGTPKYNAGALAVGDAAPSPKVHALADSLGPATPLLESVPGTAPFVVLDFGSFS